MLRMNFPGRKSKRREEAEVRQANVKLERTKKFRLARGEVHVTVSNKPSN